MGLALHVLRDLAVRIEARFRRHSGAAPGGDFVHLTVGRQCCVDIDSVCDK